MSATSAALTPSSVISRRCASWPINAARLKATIRGGALITVPTLLGHDHVLLDVVDEPLVDAAEVLLELVAERVGVAQQELGDGLVGLEELQHRLHGGPQRLPIPIGSVAGRGHRGRDVGAQASPSAAINAWKSSSFESKYW